MSASDTFSSGKSAADENFPVASRLIAPRHRDVVMRFYAVARLADDIADHSTTAPQEKLRRLDAIEHTLDGGAFVKEAAALRDALRGRVLSDAHIRDLLIAFRQDAAQDRYADWSALMSYCRYSAAPVGRFMLDVHGENRDTWAASDALCAALQVINHLPHSGTDYRDLNRVYIPLDELSTHGATVGMLGEKAASPALRNTIHALARRTRTLLEEAAPLSARVRDTRLALEIAVIQQLAISLIDRLERRDPLSDRVHHGRAEAVGLALRGAMKAWVWRLGPRQKRGDRA